jgi:yeast amino acid transporter
MSLAISAFGYLGVEIPAATALEARALTVRSNQRMSANRALKFSVVWVPFLTTCVYLIVSIFLSLDLKWDNVTLSRIESKDSSYLNVTSIPGPIEVANISMVPKLGLLFTGLLVITGITAANTNLYVASRTLFGLTSRPTDGNQSSKALSCIGQTNRKRVPMRALVISGLVFIYLPFLSLFGGSGPTKVVSRTFMHNNTKLT